MVLPVGLVRGTGNSDLRGDEVSLRDRGAGRGHEHRGAGVRVDDLDAGLTLVGVAAVDVEDVAALDLVVRATVDVDELLVGAVLEDGTVNLRSADASRSPRVEVRSRSAWARSAERPLERSSALSLAATAASRAFSASRRALIASARASFAWATWLFMSSRLEDRSPIEELMFPMSALSSFSSSVAEESSCSRAVLLSSSCSFSVLASLRMRSAASRASEIWSISACIEVLDDASSAVTSSN